MILKERIEAFVKVGLFIKRHFDGQEASETGLHQGLDKVIELAYIHNGWFTPNFVKAAVSSIGSMLSREAIEEFCAGKETQNVKTVAVICAGNIPMVAFHDMLCVLLSGHKLLVKLSTDDDVLLPFFIKLLAHYEPKFENSIYFAGGKLANFDAVIATGSNNTSGYFDYYFGKYPNIIRKNRSSVAVLSGNESTGDLNNLGKDIFMYFGLGCRNVSQLLVPAGYDFKSFFESIVDYGYVIENKKYGNNYDYHRAIYLLEKQQFLDNNFVMLKESDSLHSPVGTVYYSFYGSQNNIDNYLNKHQNDIQCIIGKGFIPFGYSQQPVITDFADNVNTWEFLLTL